MRRLFRHRLAYVFVATLLAIALPLVAGARETAPELVAFASRAGLTDAAGFAETVTALRSTGRLPTRYLTKSDAERAGWKPGSDLCRTSPGKSIGGDSFGNREKRLPEGAGRRWREADLDYACGRRGARRLVWSSDGLFFVTLDHYETFQPVPGSR
jgi:ribonuclease T1